MAAPIADIASPLNPVSSDRRVIESAVPTVTGVKYGVVVIGDTGTNNFRDVKLPTADGPTGVRGVVTDQGDPNNSGAFAVGDELGVCMSGVAEALLKAGATATKDEPCIAANGGFVIPVAGSAPYDIVGTFRQTKTAGANAELVSINVTPYRRFS